MRVPAMAGLIRRRVLVNLRVEPEAIRPYVPAAFELTTVNGYAMAGICLIRLERVRPSGTHPAVGFASDNVAYRVAVRWQRDGRSCDGVFIPRRDTSSRLQRRLGGRLFPGEYHHAVFESHDRAGAVVIASRSDDGEGDVRLVAHESDGFPPGSVFRSLAEASTFFEQGSIGYSATRDPVWLDGLLLRTEGWSVAPLDVERLESSFFDDPARFPRGTVTLDDALIMRNTEHDWRSLPGLRAAASASTLD